MSIIITPRLIIQPLELNDSEFILELLNTKGWLQFIGDRNIKTIAETKDYIQKIVDNPNFTYFVFRLKESQLPLGIITLVKRDALDYPDFGFSLLPQYGKHGFAFEAGSAVLQYLETEAKQEIMLAITLPENQNSIALLEKLDFIFEKEIEENDEKLLLYSKKVKT
ncbi:GNAT family N-acetyltransferase [Flavobacterium phycosphaerae]|uniref:GNAT family N-acetyltransferase n=1 Tax=Flavobacterium phycosphaerae TaxID=2697515 RepID=UPI00138997F2|nr:GNAT family N-acetyltransferase [Flavobacterium phycosphaerae]